MLNNSLQFDFLFKRLHNWLNYKLKNETSIKMVVEYYFIIFVLDPQLIQILIESILNIACTYKPYIKKTKENLKLFRKLTDNYDVIYVIVV